MNFPNTIQLGSVTDVDISKLERIDLLLGGSPCQSFSFAGKRKGMATKCDIEVYTLEKYLQLKSDGFEFEGQSYLFWEYMRILTDIRKSNPEVKFLLENVEMGGGHVPMVNATNIIRRLTPTECARLQTIPEWYRWQCSDTQQYRMLGNGWTIEVIKHILSFLNQNT